MQVILKQSEITAALAAYMVNVLGATGVTPETLSVVYKQGRSDKNGLTAELEIEAPRYEKQLNLGAQVSYTGLDHPTLSGFGVGQEGELGNVQKSGPTLSEPTYVSDVKAQGDAPVVVVADPAEGAGVPKVESANFTAEPEPEQATPVYEGERRSEERLVEGNDEVAKVPAEDETPEVAETPAQTAAPLFG